MKRIHIIQHVPYETPGCIESWIKEKKYVLSVTELYSGAALPERGSFDWLVVMGGPMSVHDVEEYPWLSVEKKFIVEAISDRKAVIGICLGSQLIAEALGSRVYKNGIKEIGWFPVNAVDRGGGSTLLKIFNDSEIVFHWHGETFDIPAGAVHGFTSDACRNQFYIFKDRVVGLQFHLEVTEQLLENMIVNGADEIVPARYIQTAEQLRNGSCHTKRTNELMFSLLDELDRVV